MRSIPLKQSLPPVRGEVRVKGVLFNIPIDNQTGIIHSLMIYRRQPPARLGLEHKTRILLLVFLGSVLAQLSMDLYTPSFPAMQAVFATSATSIQLTLIAFWLGFGFGQLPMGYVADKFGRRPMSILSYAIFFLSTIMLLYTHSIIGFIFWRFFQGVGGAGLQVHMRIAYRDLLSGKQLKKMVSIFSAAWSAVPLFAPTIGGYVQQYFGWQMQFKVLLGLCAFFMLLNYRLLPETRSKQAIEEAEYFVQAIRSSFLNRRLMFFLSIVTLMAFALVGFVAVSPFIFQVTFALSPVHYGWVLLMVTIFNMLGSFSMGWIQHKCSQKSLYFTLFSVMAVACLGLLILNVILPTSILLVVIPMCVIYWGEGSIYVLTAANAYESFSKNIGVNSAVYGCVLMTGSALIALFASHLPHLSIVPFASILVICVLLSATVMIKGRKHL